MNKKAVILLSGGLDSATTAAIARDEGYQLSAITFDYGQRHAVELSSAAKLAAYFGITDHKTITIPAEIFCTSLVQSSEREIPKNRTITEDRIPDTYVPARNIIFLSYGVAYAESIGAAAVYIGANAVDYSGYPDCRPEFFAAFAQAVAAGTKAGVEGHTVRIETPLISKTKAEIISIGNRLGLDYAMTHSCYDPNEVGLACGQCDSCLLRKKGFQEAGIVDPTRYYE